MLKESYDDIEKKNKKLEKDLLEARAIASSASRPIVKLERYEGEGASNDEDDEEEGKIRPLRLDLNSVLVHGWTRVLWRSVFNDENCDNV